MFTFDAVMCSMDTKKKLDEIAINVELKDEFTRALYELRNLHFNRIGVKKNGAAGSIEQDMAENTLDLNMPTFGLLKQLQERENREEAGSALLSEMQDYLRVSKAAVSQMLGTLENRGLITRETDPQNRRTIIVKLTKEGNEMIDRVEQKFNYYICMMIERFGEKDTKEIIRLIYKFADIIKDIQNDSSGEK